MKGVLAILIAACLVSATFAVDDNSVVSVDCKKESIPPGSPFWGHLGSLLYQLVENTPYAVGYTWKTRYGGGDKPAFGEAGCDPKVSAEQCTECLKQLSTDIWSICHSALGGRVQYQDCWMHYECYYF